MPGRRLTGEVWDASGGGLVAYRTRWEEMYRRYHHISKRYGTDRRKTMRWHKEEEASPEIEAGQAYSNTELNAKADAWLRRDARTECCRECGGKGEETGEVASTPQEAQDGDGNSLVLEFAELKCGNDHSWFPGEGKLRGIGGEDPILFEEHIQSRKRREIYTQGGTPDPEIVSGIYNRCHPQGRKVNSPEQRKKHGASWYR